MDNVDIIDLAPARAARTLRAATQDTATAAHRLQEAFGQVHGALDRIRMDVTVCIAYLGWLSEEMAASADFCQACQDAMELADIDAMERARDSLAELFHRRRHAKREAE